MVMILIPSHEGCVLTYYNTCRQNISDTDDFINRTFVSEHFSAEAAYIQNHRKTQIQL